MTLDFLNLKHRFFPGLVAGRSFLGEMLVEIKGSEVRKDAASARRRERTHALGFLDKVLELLENNNARICGRIWIKGIGTPNDGRALYTSSIQAICADFQHLLNQLAEETR